jgi:hypothetical protein
VGEILRCHATPLITRLITAEKDAPACSASVHLLLAGIASMAVRASERLHCLETSVQFSRRDKTSVLLQIIHRDKCSASESTV